jgi:hypothetical protein
MNFKIKSWGLQKTILRKLSKITLRTIDQENSQLKFKDERILVTSLQNVLQNKLNVINKWEFNQLIKKFLISKINKFSNPTLKIMRN